MKILFRTKQVYITNNNINNRVLKIAAQTKINFETRRSSNIGSLFSIRNKYIIDKGIKIKRIWSRKLYRHYQKLKVFLCGLDSEFDNIHQPENKKAMMVITGPYLVKMSCKCIFS